MDASRFKRRTIQTPRQTPKPSPGISDIVPQALPARPVNNAYSVPVRRAPAPVNRTGIAQSKPQPIVAPAPAAPVVPPAPTSAPQAQPVQPALRPTGANARPQRPNDAWASRFRTANTSAPQPVRRPTTSVIDVQDWVPPVRPTAPMPTPAPSPAPEPEPTPTPTPEPPIEVPHPVEAFPEAADWFVSAEDIDRDEITLIENATTPDDTPPLQPDTDVSDETNLPPEDIALAEVDEDKELNKIQQLVAAIPHIPRHLGRRVHEMHVPNWSTKRWVLSSVAAVFLLVTISGSLVFARGYHKLQKTFQGTAKSVAALKKDVAPELLKGEGDGRINILMLGRGGDGHKAPDLTDTLMINSIDPVNHTSTLISIPRDLWVQVPNKGSMKLNAVWETGEFAYLHKTTPGSTDPQAVQAGFDMVDQTIESITGLTINYNVLVDFHAFKQAVDTVGGVTVNAPTDLVDPTMAWENHNDPTLAHAGENTFNGEQALVYVRSRETTSDFARAERQRAVLAALKSKVVSLGTLSNPLKISGLFDAFSDNVKTDLSIKDATRLYSIIKDVGDSSTTSLALAGQPNNYITTGNQAGQSVDIPVAGMFNYDKIQEFLRSQLKDGYIVKENAKVLVLNGTTLPGLATAKGDSLKTYGYNVIGTGNTPNSGYTETTIIDLSKGKDPYTKHYLEERFKGRTVTQLPDAQIQTQGADFVIIVGSDEVTPQS